MGISVRLIADENAQDLNDWGDSPTLKPTKSEIHWWYGTETPGWSMHLIRITDILGSTLTFRGVRLSDVDLAFGPEGDNDPSDYSVDLTNFRHVYPLHPSSLDGYVRGSENCYALLLLSNYYKTGKSEDIDKEYPDAPAKDPGKLLQFSTGGPKYPQSQEFEVIRTLKRQLAEANQRYSEAFDDALKVFAAAGLKSNPKVSEWTKNWAP